MAVLRQRRGRAKGGSRASSPCLLPGRAATPGRSRAPPPGGRRPGRAPRRRGPPATRRRRPGAASRRSIPRGSFKKVGGGVGFKCSGLGPPARRGSCQPTSERTEAGKSLTPADFQTLAIRFIQTVAHRRACCGSESPTKMKASSWSIAACWSSAVAAGAARKFPAASSKCTFTSPRTTSASAACPTAWSASRTSARSTPSCCPATSSSRPTEIATWPCRSRRLSATPPSSLEPAREGGGARPRFSSARARNRS